MRSNGLLQGRSKLSVAIKYAHEESDVIHTGIPAHVIVLVNQERERIRLEQIYRLLESRIDSTCEKIVDAVRADLDSRGIHGGDVSVARFQELLRPMQDQLNNLVADGQNLRSRSTNVTEENQTTDEGSDQVDIRMFQWGDKFRRLPEGFKFNRNMSLLQAWCQWHHGCTVLTHSIGPLKRVEQIDITDFRRDSKGQKRPIRESEVRYWHFLRNVCNDLDTAAEIRGRPSVAQLTELYCSERVGLILPPTTTDNNRERRSDELNWQYAAKVMQDMKRRRLA
jgi:hypothetical protein